MLRKYYQRGRAYLALLKAQRTQGLAPVIVNLFVTGKCNANCKYCYVDMQRQPEREFNGNEWIALIDQLIERGARMFSLVGGEPLLSPHIERIIDHLVKRNVFFVLTSNGFLVPKKIDLVKKAPVISISLDGEEKCHDAVRGKGQFQKAMEGIKAAQKLGANVRISTVISKHNIHQIDFLVELCKKENMCVTFTPCINPPEYRMKETQELQLSDEELRDFFHRLKKSKTSHPQIMNSFESIDFMIHYPTAFGTVVMKSDEHSAYYKLPCPYGRFQFIIEHTGNVYPCGIWWNHPEFQSKNIFDIGLDKALQHAHLIPCQYCSFCNLVDWNVLASLKGFFQGAAFTLKHKSNHTSKK